MEGDKSNVPKAGEGRESRLDFFSPDFDAALAFCTQGLQPPNPKVRPLDNLSKCRALLPSENPESRAAHMAVKPRMKRDEIAQRKYEETRSRVRARRARFEEKKPEGTALQRIAEGVPEGPLNLLRRAMQRQQQVRVVTRHARGVRGIATGNLVAFDGHMNLILRDVKEDYTVRLRIERTKVASRATAGSQADEEDLAEAGAKKRGKVERSRLAWKQEQRTRQLHQALLRGSSIVMVSIPPPAAPPPPPPSLGGVYAAVGTHPPSYPPSLGPFSLAGKLPPPYPRAAVPAVPPYLPLQQVVSGEGSTPGDWLRHQQAVGSTVVVGSAAMYHPPPLRVPMSAAPGTSNMPPLLSAETDRHWARQGPAQSRWSDGSTLLSAEVPPPPPEPPPQPHQSS